MKIDEIVSQSTESLKDDPGLRQEVAAELRSHFSSTVAALGVDRPPEEAERIAVECFGDPEVIDERLLEVNYSRLKFRARMRLALKILAVPLVLLAFFLAVDFKSLLGMVVMGMESAPEWLYSLAGDSPRGNQEFKMLESRPDSKEAEALYEKHIHDPVYRTHRLLSLFGKESWKKDAGAREYLQKELRRARELEPGNACYSYLLAAIELDEAVSVQSVKDAPSRVTVKNGEQFERGMAEVRRGLQQPFFNTYTFEGLQHKLGALPARKNFPGVIHDVAIRAGILLPWLGPLRTQGVLLPFYGKIQAERGDLAEADLFLNGYKTLARQMNVNATTLVDELVLVYIIDKDACVLGEIYRELGRPDLAEAAERQGQYAGELIANFRKKGEHSGNNRGMVDSRGGYFAKVWIFTGFNEVTREELYPELRLTYNLLDQALLIALDGVLTVFGIILMGLWLVFHRKGSFLLLLPGKEYAKLFLWGVLLPVGCYFLLTRIDVLSGRAFSPHVNGVLIVIQAVYFVLLMPLWAIVLAGFRLKKHLAKSGPVKQKGNLLFGNVLLLLVFFLLGTAAISRVFLSMEQRHYFEKENFVFAFGRNDTLFSVQETRMVNEWKNHNGVILEELEKEPLLLTSPAQAPGTE